MICYHILFLHIILKKFIVFSCLNQHPRGFHRNLNLEAFATFKKSSKKKVKTSLNTKRAVLQRMTLVDSRRDSRKSSVANPESCPTPPAVDSMLDRLYSTSYTCRQYFCPIRYYKSIFVMVITTCTFYERLL